MLTLKGIRNIHDSTNIPKTEFIFLYLHFIIHYLKYKKYFNLGVKTVLYLKYNRINGFVGV